MEFWCQVFGQHVIFEGSPVKMLRFWSSKLHFWRKHRTKAEFWIFKASFLKEVSHKSFVFELQSFIFEGSLAQKLRFWASKFHFWRKSRTKASFLSFKAWFLKEVSHKSFVFELQIFIFKGSLAEHLRLTKSFEPHISWQPNQSQIIRHPNHLNSESIMDNQITWISNQLTNKINRITHRLTTKPLEFQITWISNQLKSKSLESQSIWQPNHLNLKSFDIQITWIPNQWTTKSLESQINWQITNHLTLNSFESDINWLSNQLNSAHSLPIGSLSLETSATALCGRYVICCESNLLSVVWQNPEGISLSCLDLSDLHRIGPAMSCLSFLTNKWSFISLARWVPIIWMLRCM